MDYSNKCEQCKYFRDFNTGIGECRFNPPNLIMVTSRDYGKSFVHVNNDDWCGQFQERLKKDDPKIEYGE